MSTEEIQVKLLKLGKKQMDLIPVLKERGWKVHPSELSLFIKKRAATPKAESVLAMCDEIISEWETESKSKSAV